MNAVTGNKKVDIRLRILLSSDVPGTTPPCFSGAEAGCLELSEPKFTDIILQTRVFRGTLLKVLANNRVTQIPKNP